jgi:hypothetical protein
MSCGQDCHIIPASPYEVMCPTDWWHLRLTMAKMGGDRPPVSYDSWREVFHCFGTLVHHHSSSPTGSFLLLAVFRRSSFHLTEELVGMALHSVLKGFPSRYLFFFKIV